MSKVFVNTGLSLDGGRLDRDVQKAGELLVRDSSTTLDDIGRDAVCGVGELSPQLCVPIDTAALLMADRFG